MIDAYQLFMCVVAGNSLVTVQYSRKNIYLFFIFY
jgi:hypothetical protein